jgi:hypothetical protein
MGFCLLPVGAANNARRPIKSMISPECTSRQSYEACPRIDKPYLTPTIDAAFRNVLTA